MAYHNSFFVLIVHFIGMVGGLLAMFLESYAINADLNWTNFVSTEEPFKIKNDEHVGKQILMMFRRNSIYSTFGATWESVVLARNSLAEPLAILILVFCIIVSCGIFFMYFVLDPSFFQERTMMMAIVYGIETVAVYTSSVMVLYSTWLYQDLYFNLADHILLLENSNAVKYTETQKEIVKQMILYMSHCVYEVKNLDKDIISEMETVNFCQRVGTKNIVVILSMMFAISNAILLAYTVKGKCFASKIEPFVPLRGKTVPRSELVQTSAALLPVRTIPAKNNRNFVKERKIATKSIGIQTEKDNDSNEIASKGQENISSATGPKGQEHISTATAPKGQENISAATAPSGHENISTATGPIVIKRQIIADDDQHRRIVRTTIGIPKTKRQILVTEGEQTSSLENNVTEAQQTSTIELTAIGQQTSLNNIMAKDDAPKLPPAFVVTEMNPTTPIPIKPKKITKTVSQQTSADSFIIHRYVNLKPDKDDESENNDMIVL